MDAVKTYDLKNRGDSGVSFGISRMEEIYTRRQGQPDEPHRHDYYTVLVVRTAKGQHYIDFNRYELDRQQVFFISPGQVHQVVEEAQSFGFAIVFSHQFLVENNIPISFIDDLNLFNDYGISPPLSLPGSNFHEVEELAHRMEKCFNEASDMRFHSVGAYLKLLLITCHENCSRQEHNTQNLQAGNTILRTFRELVYQRFTKWHQTSAYAAALNVTPDHLNRVVRTLIGKSAKEYIQSRITIAAKRMLYFTDLTAKEIGYELGFDAPANFSAFFKKCTGQSPTEFRKTKS